jgi:GT2 family glycosyltransferase
VNWNRKDYVLSLLDSLRSMPSTGSQIVVVDNASTDGSDEAIRNHPLSVTLLENRENLGGTGGFNTGIRHVLELSDQEFIWLLDNDAEVSPDTLYQMVGAMNRDPSIGVAGSCILSPEDRTVIVEAGGFVERRSSTWMPNLRYQPYTPLQGKGLVEPVDYVPACSALVRVSVVRKIGLMDERFFLHWDDIDFCARVREAGFRVVSVLDSPAYHGAEKGHSSMTLYYDFRNALLYFGKHASGVDLLRTYMNILDSYLSSLVYLRLMGQATLANYLGEAARDFLAGRFGRAGTSPAALREQSASKHPVRDNSLSGCTKVVLFAVGSYEEIVAALAVIRVQSPLASLSVAVAANRAEAYRLPGVDRLIVYDLLKDGLVARLKTAGAILAERFSYGVTAGNGFTVPYAFLLGRNFTFEPDGALVFSEVSWRGVWKLPTALLLGKLCAALLLIPTWAAARNRIKLGKDLS